MCQPFEAVRELDYFMVFVRNLYDFPLMGSLRLTFNSVNTSP